ncbi:outer membrane beta-barrel protein [Psittacicella gerlachiana]|uniref:Outer membrane protein beta-barrel domain-containing protein n=1 Tax=Psittacicella gerlachiana TaxID=2028574 RepID=A0A3A1YDW0_9GAMM|nr:outer membrane beta-barrel protein [Psittacicella gerlachiana]RIY35606.1 hypothetical protein CKF59_03415 [Psittacicella gerlachiana]
MKLQKTLTALAVASALTFATTATANTNFAEQKFRLDTNLGFKVSNFSVKDSNEHLNAGSFQLNLAGHYFVFNNGAVALGLGAELGGSVGRYTIGSPNNHFSSETYTSSDTTNTSRRYSDYNAGLSLLAAFHVEKSTFTPYVQFSVGYQNAQFRVNKTTEKFRGVYTKLGAGVSWSNGFTAGAYVSLAPSQSLANSSDKTKATAYTVGAQFGWKF